MALLLLGSALLSVTGCEEDCILDDQGLGSVTVRITDHLDNPVVPDSMTYSVNGRASQDCECVTADINNCSVFVCGWDEPGRFELRAEYQGRVAEEQVTVSVEECSVVGESITLVIPPS